MTRRMRALVCACGMVFCLLNLYMPEKLCAGAGCSLSAQMSFLGFSFWAWGALAFSALLFSLKSERAFRILSSLFLFCDCVLLAWMAFGAICLMCACAGLLLFLAAFPGKARKAWLLCLVLLCGSAAASSPPVPLTRGTSSLAVWFSPDCAACVRALEKYPDAALYPVNEKGASGEVVAMMSAILESGESPRESLERARMRMRNRNSAFSVRGLLWKAAMIFNQGKLLGRGYRHVPVIVSEGLDDGGEALSCGEGRCSETGFDMDGFLKNGGGSLRF